MAQWVFWASAAALFYVYAGYPALLLAISLFVRRPQPEPDYEPTISVLIAAYNEEATIARKIQQTLALDYPADKLEIMVLSDCSTDRTDEIVKSVADARVALLRIPYRKGKTHAQNVGVRQANGEILVFSDATTIYHPKALRFLVAHYRDRTVGGVSGRYQYFDATGDSPTGLGTIAFWNYENLIKSFQARIKTLSGCCGCIYSVRKSAYTNLADDIISDLVQPLWLIQKGYRVAFDPRALAYEQSTQTTRQEFRMRVRVVTRAMRGLISVPDLLRPWRYPWISFQLLSHKVIRWLVPFLLIVLYASTAALAAHPAWFYLLLLQTGMYTFALASLVVPFHRKWKPLGIPLYFCTLNAAALMSMLEILRGRKYVVWQTVRSEQ
jgi:cellulose synthase/poly-beta-1,6-N-acetylglucosamine synthase-like glycosyltransferase